METAYIKSTVGPILSEALTSLVLHVPYQGQKPSSYDTTVDPISYLGNYLLKHVESEKKKSELNSQQEYIEGIEKAWKESQARQSQARDMLQNGLAARLSVRRSQIEASEVAQAVANMSTIPDTEAPIAAEAEEVNPPAPVETTEENIPAPAEE